MERKSGSDGSGRRGGQSSVTFPAENDHQSIAVAPRERSFSNDKSKACSRAECRDFDRNVSKTLKVDWKEKPTINETTEKYLQDSYKQAFQKHVDNLANVISQHKRRGTEEKGAKERGEAESLRAKSDRSSNSAPQASLAPLTRLEIKSDTGINQIVTFGQEDNEEEFEKEMNVAKNVSLATGKLHEENFLESLVEPNPMITFNHVCTEEETERIGFHQIISKSRSQSPMLEVPNSPKREKITTRPPL